MADLGVRLQLLVGATVPRPVPFEVVEALQQVQVRNRDRERDAFQLTFAVGKDSLVDYGLVRQGYFDPPARVTVAVLVFGMPQVLINGVVVNLQLVPSGTPGASRFVVTGEDVSFDLTTQQRSATYKNQSDSAIVSSIVAKYGLKPDVTSTSDTPAEQQRITVQQGTDLDFVRTLAERNGFVFFVEPTAVPGTSSAYWGPQRHTGPPQPALTVSRGPGSTVDGEITFGFDATSPATPVVRLLEPRTGLTVEIPLPASLPRALSVRPAASLRTVIARDTANLDPVQAALRALVTSTSGGDAVTGRGQVDVTRYGRALRSRQLVDVGGAGSSYDGTYYVQEVTHEIRRGSYTQSFVLSREGLGTSSPRIST